MAGNLAAKLLQLALAIGADDRRNRREAVMGQSISIGVLASLVAAIFAVEAESAAAAPPRHACFGSRDIASPDGKLVARVERRGGAGCGESRVEILERHGRRLALKDFTSPDGSHGETLERAVWSEDGSFFVFSLSSSGGHEAQHFPTYVFSRRGRSFRNVEALDPQLFVASADFQLAGDTLTVSALDGSRTTLRLH
jgi:hypothetical protein